MPGSHTLAMFVIGALATLLMPGPSVLFVVGRAAERGVVAGLVSVLGVEAGTLVHVAAAVAGVSGLVASSPATLSALRLGGGAYLLWLAWCAWRAPKACAGPSRSHGRAFRDGFLVDVLNPKTALFFVAFLPGFVRQGDGPVSVQVACLGACFVALAVLVEGTYALAAARLARALRADARRLARISATTYALLGLLVLIA